MPSPLGLVPCGNAYLMLGGGANDADGGGNCGDLRALCGGVDGPAAEGAVETDSDDDWLAELLTTPSPNKRRLPAPEGGDNSDDEWLADLLDGSREKRRRTVLGFATGADPSVEDKGAIALAPSASPRLPTPLQQYSVAPRTGHPKGISQAAVGAGASSEPPTRVGQAALETVVAAVRQVPLIGKAIGGASGKVGEGAQCAGRAAGDLASGLEASVVAPRRAPVAEQRPGRPGVPQFTDWAGVDVFLARRGRGWPPPLGTLAAPPPLDVVTRRGLQHFDLRDASCMPGLLQVLRALSGWRRVLGPIAFKIGIAADPEHRYRNKDFGYVLEHFWQFMHVLLAGNAQRCRLAEMDAIAALRGVPGCHNASPGGEGVASGREHLCYVYIVVRAASQADRRNIPSSGAG